MATQREPTRARRVRRNPSEARRRILEAAEARLSSGGPVAVRVQRIAADLGVTDAAIYHHFGDREGLLDALARFGARRLRESVEQIMVGWDEEGLPVPALVDAMVDTFQRRGYANLILWLADAGLDSDRGSGMFEVVARAFEQRATAGGRVRSRRSRGPVEPRFAAALLVMVCVAEPLFGSMSRRSVGLSGSRQTTRPFRAWFAEAVESLLEGR